MPFKQDSLLSLKGPSKQNWEDVEQNSYIYCTLAQERKINVEKKTMAGVLWLGSGILNVSFTLNDATILINEVEFSQNSCVCLLWKCSLCHLCFQQVTTVSWNLLAGIQCHTETMEQHWLEARLTQKEQGKDNHISRPLRKNRESSFCQPCRNNEESQFAGPVDPINAPYVPHLPTHTHKNKEATIKAPKTSTFEK